MSGVRVLVGTRKGAFVLTSDERREHWQIDGPHFPGWEVYHFAGSPADPDRVYASQSSGWFGQVMQRSDDGGKTWEPVGNDFTYAGVPGQHQWYDGTLRPWEFTRVWHLEPSPSDADTVYAGVQDAALFKTTDGGHTWTEVRGLREHGSGPDWQPGAGGMCLHTILLDPTDEQRMIVAISAAGVFRTLDGGQTWEPTNKGLLSDGIPSPAAEVGHCVHNLAMHPANPQRLFMQKHWDVMRSDDGGDSWTEITATCRATSAFRSRFTRTSPTRSTSCPSRATRTTSAGRSAARLPQPHRRRRVGGVDERAAAGALLSRRAARRHGRRHAARVRHLLRHDRWPGLRLGRFRGHVDGGRARPARRALGRGPDAGMST